MPSFLIDKSWWVDARNEGQRPFKKLRYYHRQWLKPADVPKLKNADLKLELYRRYGHPYTSIVEAMEAHVICRTIGIADGLSTWSTLPMKLCCFLVGLLFTAMFTVSVALIVLSLSPFILMLANVIVDILSLCTAAYMQNEIEFGTERNKAIEDMLSHYHDEDVTDEARTRYEWIYEFDNLGTFCLEVLVGLVIWTIILTGIIWFMTHYYDSLKIKLKVVYIAWRYKSGEECAICYTGKRTQCFEPCGHLVCCISCADELLECPMCKEFILREHTTTPLTPQAYDDVIGTPCGVCGADDRTQSHRILVPCGHVIKCKDSCARLLDDCPVCWEEVTDDLNVYLP